ncbi:hypothetical protein BIV60_25745 [Bacillus sp. MUM 116]|uniref:DUF2642 domain-containing protein n=1 Tax=Bacillus sp. MUM 116 TaxID=1678002 RepID=UPI0008F5DBE6|nr:DUF2642 domain-containing protein [Bacillus sp. MUM 116]OIK08615.1 hypothetical protein BIV60_25745 [Bacillus sp. MUM 116]
MTDFNFHQIANELLKKEVEITTLQGSFNGRLKAVGSDVVILHSRGRGTPIELTIRIETIVAIFRVEMMVPRGPFGFNPLESQIEHEDEHHHESN